VVTSPKREEKEGGFFGAAAAYSHNDGVGGFAVGSEAELVRSEDENKR
jgi:hypothetical protein